MGKKQIWDNDKLVYIRQRHVGLEDLPTAGEAVVMGERYLDVEKDGLDESE